MIDPVADVLVTRIAQDAVGQDDACSTTGLEPLDAPLDEQHFGRYGGLDGVGHHEAIALPLPAAGELVLLEDGPLGDRNIGAERRVRHQDVDGAERDVVIGRLNARQVATRKLQRVHVIEVAQRIAGHHHVHLCSTHQEGVEVGTEEVLSRVAGKTVADGDELLGVFLAGLDVALVVEHLVHVVQGLDEEAPGTTR